ncbi:RHS repeat-associated core domain-containing protein [Budvicia aquatica]|uniref:RHS repeat-associated core domain-containing protein n=1 Tax=Budvicia aquatica TaxID=82979 RepID=UPI00208085D8|nr:RHS repeat-associated core domain-containing protein [Budvicia aquatica]GKX53155.1 type IV secretion protein Rhs [Budvicia aquatica]
MDNFGSVYHTANNVNNQAPRKQFTATDKEQLYTDVIEGFTHCLDGFQDSLTKRFMEAARNTLPNMFFPLNLLAAAVKHMPLDGPPGSGNSPEPRALTNSGVVAMCERTKTRIIRYGYGGFSDDINSDDAFVPFPDTAFKLLDGAGKEVFSGKFNAQGESEEFHNVSESDEYTLIINPDVNKEEYEAWLQGYAPVMSTLLTWLNDTWADPKNQASWTSYLALPAEAQGALEAKAMGEGVATGAEHFVTSIYDIASGIMSLTPGAIISNKIRDVVTEQMDMPKRPENAFDKLLKIDITPEDLTRTKETLKKLGTNVQDDAMLYLYLEALLAWRRLLPPKERANIDGQVFFEVLALALSGVFTAGVGAAVKGASTLAKLSVPFVRTSIESLIKTTRAVAVMAVMAKSARTLNKTHMTLKFGPFSYIREGKSIIEIRRGYAPYTDLKVLTAKPKPKPKPEPNPSRLDEATDTPVGSKDTTGDPIAMINGEELLALDDIALPGLLPFTFSRLYRTSRVSRDCGLGDGWSHSLDHHMRFEDDNDLAYWMDNEGRIITLPLPTEVMPFVDNPVAGGELYLGHNGLYIARSTESPLTYYFTREAHRGRLVAIKDRYQNTLTLHYNPQGQLVRLSPESLNGPALLLSWQDDHITEVAFARYSPKEADWQAIAPGMIYGYNTEGQLISAENAAQETERYTYDNQNVILSRELAGGATFYWEWEDEGEKVRCIRHWGNFNQLDVRYQWDIDNGLGTLINQDGTKEIYQHGEKSLLLAKITPDGARVDYQYNDDGKKIAESDALGHTTRYDYDQQGNLETIIYPDERVVYLSYQRGLVDSVRDGDKLWQYVHNAVGDITQSVNPLGQSTRYVYNERGQKTEATYPNGIRQRWVWGDDGELLEETLSDGRLRRYTYDNLLRIVEQSDELNRTTAYQYDPLGRLSVITFPDSRTREYQYNPYGKVTRLKDEAGRLTTYDYDAPLHLLTKKTLPDGQSLQYRYDNLHLQVSEIENQKGEVYRIGYTPTGLINEEIGFDNVKTTYAYDLNGKLIEKQEFGNQHDEKPLITRYIRDTVGRLMSRILPDGSEEKYQYDNHGRLSMIQAGKEVLAWEYNRADQLTAEHQNWATLRHYYSKQTGLLTGTKLPDGQKMGYHHIDGQLRGITLDDNPIAAFSYDNSGRERERRQGNGLINRFQYDEMGRLSRHYLREGMGFDDNPQTLWQQDYQYQSDGELAKIVGNNARDYRYDEVGQLTSVGYPEGNKDHHHAHHVETFKYDVAGNRISDDNSATGNRLAFFGDRHFEYDRFGNLIAERRGKEHKLLTTYEYDCRHRLIKHVSPNGRVSTYTYDTFNRRTSKTVDGKTIDFIWQGNKLIAECSDKDTVWRSYLYEPGSFRPLALVEGNAKKKQKIKTYWYQNDHLGTPHSLTDSLGNLVYSCSYNAYGKLQEETQHRQEEFGIRVETNLRFQGQYWDEETGLHYNLNRYYDPALGRYLTQDPIKLGGGLNGYQYVNGNPVNWIDPLGLFNVADDGFAHIEYAKDPQMYTPDLSHVTGTGAKAREKAIDSIIKEDFPNLDLTYTPQYSPFIGHGVAMKDKGTQLGKKVFSSRDELRDTIIHEELHHRWWRKGILDHHPRNSLKEEKFYLTIERYKQMRKWDNE